MRCSRRSARPEARRSTCRARSTERSISMTSSSSSRFDWLVFFARGLILGSSLPLIKIAVSDFATFTLVAVRRAIGAALLWTVLGLRGQPLPRQRRIYGHLFVMGLVNITIPFLLITWAE